MLGITYHNPATISVFLDRMRFRDCFISNDETRKGDWKKKLKAFTDLPSDGRDRVVLVESFATLQTLLRNGATLDTVKVAVYDDCDVLAKVPGVSIVDAHINGTTTDTWQLYTVSFDEFNDALASQPTGVPALVRDHDVKENTDIPEPPKAAKKEEEADDEDDDSADESDDKPRSVLVMEQLLDNIERDGDEDDDDSDDDVSEPEVETAPEPDPEPEPEPDGSRVVLKKRTLEAPPPEPAPVDDEPETAPIPVAPERPATPPPEPVQKSKPKRKRSKKPEPPKSYELF